jgi:hypothetical protein
MTQFNTNPTPGAAGPRQGRPISRERQNLVNNSLTT